MVTNDAFAVSGLGSKPELGTPPLPQRLPLTAGASGGTCRHPTCEADHASDSAFVLDLGTKNRTLSAPLRYGAACSRIDNSLN